MPKYTSITDSSEEKLTSNEVHILPLWVFFEETLYIAKSTHFRLDFGFWQDFFCRFHLNETR